MPIMRAPAWATGIAIRPVPQPSSRTGPSWRRRAAARTRRRGAEGFGRSPSRRRARSRPSCANLWSCGIGPLAKRGKQHRVLDFDEGGARLGGVASVTCHGGGKIAAQSAQRIIRRQRDRSLNRFGPRLPDSGRGRPDVRRGYGEQIDGQRSDPGRREQSRKRGAMAVAGASPRASASAVRNRRPSSNASMPDGIELQYRAALSGSTARISPPRWSHGHLGSAIGTSRKCCNTPHRTCNRTRHRQRAGGRHRLMRIQPAR